MSPVPFPEQTSVLGAPPDWDAKKHGPCDGLPVHFADGIYTSCWRATWRERLALLFGARLWLTVVSSGHPPVALGVKK